MGFVALCVVLGVTLTQNRQIRHRERKLTETVSQLREQLIENGLLYALNDDRENTERVISELESLDDNLDEVDKGKSIWPDLLRGQLKLYGSNPADAIPILRDASERALDNITAKGMYASALVFNGNPSDYRHLLDELRQCSPAGQFEKLFVGQLFAMSMTSEDNAIGEKLVNEALAVGKSPLGLAIQAQLLGHRALDKGDVPIAETAQRRIIAAREYLPNNYFVAMIYVSVHHTCCNLDVRGVDRARVLQVIEEVGDFGNYAIGHIVVAMTYQDLEMWQEAEDSLRRASETGDWWSSYAGMLIAEGRTHEAREFMTRMLTQHETDDDGKAWKRMFKNLADVVDSKFDREAATRKAATADVSDSEFECLLYVLLASGENKRVERLIESRRKRSEDYVGKLLSTDYLVGEHDLQTVKQELGHSNLSLGNALFTLGLVDLSKGNAERAIDWFQACLDTKDFFANGYYDSQVFIRLIEQGKLPMAQIRK